MRIKIVAFWIVVFSFLSWIFGSMFTMKYLYEPKWNDLFKANNITSVTISELESDVIKVANSVSDSVVSIYWKRDTFAEKESAFWVFWWKKDDSQITNSSWTGFIVSEDWLILTNKHVISDKFSTYYAKTKSGKEYVAKVLAKDPLTDLAVIKINSKTKFPKANFIQNINEIKLGQFSIAIWNSLWELENSVSLWVVSGKNRTLTPEWTRLSGLIQTDAIIVPWNSWGPLINIEWKVIWINTAKATESNGLWFAIPMTEERVNYLLKSIKKYGEIKKPYLWIKVLTVTDFIKEDLALEVPFGDYINEIDKGSPAEKAGLKKWDVVLKVDKTSMKNYLVMDIIQNKIPWDVIELEIFRDWKIKNITVKLDILSWKKLISE